jgi:hypothetical protein
MDPNIAKIIERTRARRPFVGKSGGETPLKTLDAERERSPLKQRNFDQVPISRESPGKAGGSPQKTGLEARIADSPSDTVKRLLAGKDMETSVKELIARLVAFWLYIFFLVQFIIR